MKLYVNEKMLSIHDRFYVKDEFGNDVFQIFSKVFSIGDKTTILDLQGTCIAYIEEEIFHFLPHYNIYINGNYICNISRKFQLFKNDYILSNGYRVDGNFLMFDFSIFNSNNQKIATISRKFLTLGDKYEIDILDESELNLILSIVVAIKNDVNNGQNSSAN